MNINQKTFNSDNIKSILLKIKYGEYRSITEVAKDKGISRTAIYKSYPEIIKAIQHKPKTPKFYKGNLTYAIIAGVKMTRELENEYSFTFIKDKIYYKEFKNKCQFAFRRNKFLSPINIKHGEYIIRQLKLFEKKRKYDLKSCAIFAGMGYKLFYNTYVKSEIILIEQFYHLKTLADTNIKRRNEFLCLLKKENEYKIKMSLLKGEIADPRDLITPSDEVVKYITKLF